MYKLSNYGIDTVGNLIWSTLPPGCKIIIFFLKPFSLCCFEKNIFLFCWVVCIFIMFSIVNVSPLSNSKCYLYKQQKYINLFYWLEYKTPTSIFGQGIFACFFFYQTATPSVFWGVGEFLRVTNDFCCFLF